MYGPGHEPAPPSVVSVAYSNLGPEDEPVPGDMSAPPYHSAAAGGPDLSRHDGTTAATLRAAAAGDLEFGLAVTEENMNRVLDEFRAMPLPLWSVRYGLGDGITWKIAQDFYPGHVVWTKTPSDDLGAVLRGCSCQWESYGAKGEGRHLAVNAPKCQ